jgi:hypothetical protein
MSERQWLRSYELTIGSGGGQGIKTSGLRVAFDIKKGGSESPNEAVIKVWNLSHETLLKSRKEFDRVILQAGYEENYGLIYTGGIIGQRVMRENGTDIVLELACGDGDEAYTSAALNRTLAAGARPEDIVKAVRDSFQEYGAAPGETPELRTQRLPRGKVMFGMTRKYAREAAYTNGVSWSIQDGKMVMVKNDGYLPGEAVVLTSETGLIGSPEQTNDGVKVKCLLNPKIRVNGRIKIDNSSVIEAKKETGKDAKEPSALNSDGFYRVLKAVYTGDTRGQDWYCDMVCVSIDASADRTTDLAER